MLHEGSEILARISEVINCSVCSNQEKKDFMQQKGHEQAPEMLLGFIWIPHLEHISKGWLQCKFRVFCSTPVCHTEVASHSPFWATSTTIELARTTKPISWGMILRSYSDWLYRLTYFLEEKKNSHKSQFSSWYCFPGMLCRLGFWAPQEFGRDKLVTFHVSKK